MLRIHSFHSPRLQKVAQKEATFTVKTVIGHPLAMPCVGDLNSVQGSWLHDQAPTPT